MSLGRAEQRFLLRAALELPAEPNDLALDWAAIDARARKLGLAGLAWQAAAKLDAGLAKNGYAELRRHALHDAAQTALTVNAFVRATHDLRAAGLRCMALKGIALVSLDATYVPLRHVSDLDLLVEAHDVERADEVLRAAGARRLERRPTMAGDATLAAAAREPHASGVASYLDARGVALDLHVAPPVPTPGAHQGLWGRSVEVELQGVPVLIPARRDQLTILCEHALRHHAGDPRLLLRHMADVARLARLEAEADPGGAPPAPPSVAESLLLLEEARRAAAGSWVATLTSRVARAVSPGWAGVEGAGRAIAFRVQWNAGYLRQAGRTALFPSRAYLASAYEAPERAWWLPILYVRRLLIDQPLTLLGLRKSRAPRSRAPRK